MKKLKNIEKVIIILTIVYLVVAAIVYPNLPDKFATHWNIEGTADGFSSKLFGVLLMPFFFLFILGVYSVFSRTKYTRIKKLEKPLNITILLTILFLFYISILSLIYNLGYTFNMSYFVILATSMLMIALGFILKKIKKINFYFGIRTPWTLIDQEVWEKTHIFGGRVFVGFGVLLLFSVFFFKYFTYIFISLIVILLVTIYSYSYYVYKKKK